MRQALSGQSDSGAGRTCRRHPRNVRGMRQLRGGLPRQSETGAQRYRTARRLLAETVPVYVSLAPSWVSEFRGVSAAQLVRALKELGVAGVSETALGAQLVSVEIARELDGGSPGLLLSSACPTSVDFIRKYLPELAGRITPVASPLIAHCRLLRDTFGENIRTIFIGPCIAKKNESDRHPDLLNLALTYPELRQLFREEGIDPARVTPRAEDSFVPEAAEEGARYPIEGGMNDTIAFQTRNRKVHYVTLSGLENIDLALSGIRELPKGETVFVEMLACHGGCVHGPCAEHDSPGLLERLRVLNYARLPEQPRRRTAKGGIGDDFPAAAFEPPVPGINEIVAALRSIGKNSPEDELNCDGCGYDTCRNFAQALLAGRAEPSMCVSYLKKQAQKKPTPCSAASPRLS